MIQRDMEDDCSNSEDLPGLVDETPTDTTNTTNCKEDEDTVIIESINITNLNYNDAAITSRGAAVVFLQEHKLKGKAVKKIADRMRAEKWTLKCGPCDETTKKPNAGVGVAINEEQGCKVIHAKCIRRHS